MPRFFTDFIGFIDEHLSHFGIFVSFWD